MPITELYNSWRRKIDQLRPSERSTRKRNFTWLLATNLASPQATLQVYRRRMWIAELYGDLKGNGFDLESTHLRSFLRLSRLTLAVVLLYVRLAALGS